MGDHHHSDAHAAVDVLNEPEDIPGSFGVQSAGGLVAQEHPGAGGKSPGDGHPLLLTAGELGGIGVRPARQVHQLQQLPGPARRLPPGCARQLQGKADVVQGRALHEEVEALEDHADGLSGLPELLGAQAQHVPAVHHYLPAGGPLQQIDAAHQGALARAAEPNDAENFPRPDIDADILQGADLAVPAAEALGQMPQLNNGFSHTTSPLLKIKKPSSMISHQGRRRMHRVTTLFYPRLAAETSAGTNIPRRYNGRSRRNLVPG